MSSNMNNLNGIIGLYWAQNFHTTWG
jgi:hypothetical protein